MDSTVGLIVGVIFSLCVVLLTKFIGPNLRKNFTPLPVWRGVLWYRWKSLPSQQALNFSPFTGIKFPYSLNVRAKSAWLGFILHFIFMTFMITWAKIRYSTHHTHNCPVPTAPSWCDYTNKLEIIHYVFLIGTAIFVILHLLQTHYSYDGIAQDAAEMVPIIGTVLSLVVLALMQQTERGLVFGYGLDTETFIALTNIARRFHPFIVGWDIVFTFWYHPMEGGVHHIPGLLPLLCIFIQGCLLFTTVHLNPIWRVALELLGFPHAIYIEYSHPERGRWKMFLTGVLLTPIVVHFHMFNMSFILTTSLLVCYVTLVVVLYRDMPWYRWTEPLHFPCIIFLLIFLVYGIMYIPYSVTNVLGMWPEVSTSGAIPSGFNLAVWICGTFLVVSIVVMTFVLADLLEGIARNYASTVGDMNSNVAKVFRMGNDTNNHNIRMHDLPVVTLDEVARHNTKNDAWIVINKYVYDVTNFIDYHPGSRAILLEQCGRDGTAAFDGIKWGTGHPVGTISDMKGLLCGRL
ncbi:hypothetical protein LOD99_11334 [Oopsacas minuta]|uniref:Cytochrome b5 heme-binding domain-containing protein n=1 Tax=Oopsacas minuta TaxID=111878 RepID=A0AAV7K5N8_9METZ|nr:hypothetical protein LOD99_11334 [Oopsacas minuta]